MSLFFWDRSLCRLYVWTKKLQRAIHSSFTFSPASMPSGHSHTVGSTDQQLLGLTLSTWVSSCSLPQPKQLCEISMKERRSSFVPHTWSYFCRYPQQHFKARGTQFWSYVHHSELWKIPPLKSVCQYKCQNGISAPEGSLSLVACFSHIHNMSAILQALSSADGSRYPNSATPVSEDI